MSNYFGDIAEDATIRIPFNTFSSNDPAASVTATDLADADIKVHKDGSATQIVTDGATISIDFDGAAGCHYAIIDTSAHSDYSTGSDYDVRLEGITVDAGTLNPWIGSFSIQNRYSAAAIDAVKAETALIVADTNELQSDDVPGLIATLDAVVDTVKVDTAAILVDTGTTIPATITTIDNEIATIDGIVDAILVDTGTTLPATLATIDGIVDSILVDTNELQTDWANGGRLDLILDTAAAGGGGGDATEAKQDTIIANLATVDGIVDSILVDTGTTIPATITTIDNEIAVIDGIVDAILVDTGTTLPATLATIDGIVDDILVDTGTTIPATITTAQNDLDIITGASGVNLLTATQASIDAIEADTNELQTDWANGGRLDLILDTAAAGGGGGGDATEAKQDTIIANLATVDGVADAILVDTNELQTDWANGGRLDLILDAILVDTSATGGAGADATTLDLKVGGVALADADVWLTSDSAGNTVVAGTKQSDSNGEVLFMLDNGNTYYIWAQKDGYNAIQGESFTASAD